MSIEKIFCVAMLLVGMQFATVAQTSSDCNRVSGYFNKKVCSGIENNQASFIKDLMQRKSSGNSSPTKQTSILFLFS